MEVFAARHVLPVISRPLVDGAVAIDRGTIVGVGSRADVLRSVGEGRRIHDLGDAVLLPGLVNAHTHLELSWLEDEGLPRGDYVAWLRELLARRERRHAGPPARDAAARALARIVERGTVAIGDVANEAWVAPLLARSPLHGVLFVEIYGLDAKAAEHTLREAARRLEELAANPDVAAARDRLRLALTPHAPHTTSPALLRALAGRATAARAPLSLHVAESEAEVSLLGAGTGPLIDLFAERGFVGPDWTPPGRTPVEYLKRLGVLSSRTVAVHCVHVDNTDQSILQAAGATVVSCPRSNAQLGVGKSPIAALLRAGIPVALGTDSLASVPDLDLWAEMRALRADHPSLSPAAVLRMATINGARALGLADRLGSIEVGKAGELIVLPLTGAADRPYDVIASGPDKVLRLTDVASDISAVPS